MKFSQRSTGMIVIMLAGSALHGLGQASVGSMADFRKKQDDGIAETIRMSQERARTGKLLMGSTPEDKLRHKKPKAGSGLVPPPPEHPAVIRIGVRSTQTGFDNRRQNNVR